MECDNMTDFRVNDIGDEKKGIKVYLFLKRLIDIVGSLVGLILLSPIFLIVAIAIKFDSKGPIIFGHTRKGIGGKDIKVYKFRTMYQNSQEIFDNFTKEQKEEFYKNFKLENDPRVTKIGDFLRRTSIDELPQLINILNGTMSIVGPRPIVEKEVTLYAEYAPKHSPMGCKIQVASNNLAKQLAAQATQSQPPTPKPNKMIVDLKSHDDKKQSRDDSLSW